MSKKNLALGVKLIEFESMTATIYNIEIAGNNPRCRPVVSDEEEGYLVIYQDGYQSWSPKSVFDKSYAPIQVDENDEIITDFVDNFITINEELSTDDYVYANTMAGDYDVKCVKTNEKVAISTDLPFNFTSDEIIQHIRENVKDMLTFVYRWGKLGLRNI